MAGFGEIEFFDYERETTGEIGVYNVFIKSSTKRQMGKVWRK